MNVRDVLIRWVFCKQIKHAQPKNQERKHLRNGQNVLDQASQKEKVFVSWFIVCCGSTEHFDLKYRII